MTTPADARASPDLTPLEEGWLALCLVEGLGARTVQRLLDAFGSVEAVLAATPEAISRNCGLAPALAGRIARAREAPALRTERRLLADHGVRVLPRGGEAYPAHLHDVHLPPPLLYCKGTWPMPRGPWVAVVGTRGHTRYGEKLTRTLIDGVAAAAPDAVIISGLARGIDTVAHTAALEAGLHTLAVLGGGLTRVYPPENLELAGRIQERGALLSEFPMRARPLARNFPIRNRVIAGLADALLVVEAGARSGALITASFAINYGRRVLALPGNADQPESEGTNRLIQSGQAAMVLAGADILAALRAPRVRPVQLGGLAPESGAAPAAEAAPTTGVAPAAPAPGAGAAVVAALDGDKGRIVACLRRGPLHPDELAGETALPIERLIALLLELELSGEIVQTAENHYALA